MGQHSPPHKTYGVTMHFDFTIEEANYILNVLGDRPFKESAAVIQKIQAQAQAQQAQAPAPAPEQEDRPAKK